VILVGSRESEQAPELDFGLIESEISRLTNEARANNGVAPLTSNAALQDIANVRASELTARFSHTRPNGESWASLVPEGMFTTASENIARMTFAPIEWDTETQIAQRFVDLWVGSTGHRQNILNESFNVGGFSITVGEDGYLYGIQVFGGRR
jgi:uncharacterized protein YkwD